MKKETELPVLDSNQKHRSQVLYVAITLTGIIARAVIYIKKEVH